jgi:hypothetical protein
MMNLELHYPSDRRDVIGRCAAAATDDRCAMLQPLLRLMGVRLGQHIIG